MTQVTQPQARLDQSPDPTTRSAYSGPMSRGRHALPDPPRREVPLVVSGVVVTAAAIGLVWVVDESWVVQAGVTGVLVMLGLILAAGARSTHKTATALWNESIQHRTELSDLRGELSDLQSQHRELLLELRAMRTELLASAEETARQVEEATDQRALMHDLRVSRLMPSADPVYPSLHLPLVRAAFSTELPVSPSPESVSTSARTDLPGGDDVGGAEPQPPRQLLDLTASEIARLRPAN
jgi:hypothetical protein